MNDFFADPDYPDRPQHPDFHRLMGVVAYLDGQAVEGNKPADEVAAQVVDMESLEYMAIQRAIRASQITGLPVPTLASLYLDGFVTGVFFQREGGHRDG